MSQFSFRYTTCFNICFLCVFILNKIITPILMVLFANYFFDFFFVVVLLFLDNVQCLQTVVLFVLCWDFWLNSGCCEFFVVECLDFYFTVCWALFWWVIKLLWFILSLSNSVLKLFRAELGNDLNPYQDLSLPGVCQSPWMGGKDAPFRRLALAGPVRVLGPGQLATSSSLYFQLRGVSLCACTNFTVQQRLKGTSRQISRALFLLCPLELCCAAPSCLSLPERQSLFPWLSGPAVLCWGSPPSPWSARCLLAECQDCPKEHIICFCFVRHPSPVLPALQCLWRVVPLI